MNENEIYTVFTSHTIALQNLKNFKNHTLKIIYTTGVMTYDR